MNSLEVARNARAHALKMVHAARASHIGSALSMVDVLAVLYNDVRRAEDHVIVSKGHAAVGLYGVLAEVGILAHSDLETYGKDGS
ncbi:MAG: transketolase, partial [bacterium]